MIRARALSWRRIVPGWAMLLGGCALLWGTTMHLQRAERLASDEARQRRALAGELRGLFTLHIIETLGQLDAEPGLGQALRITSGSDGSSMINAEVDTVKFRPRFQGFRVELTFDNRADASVGPGLAAVTVIPPPGRFEAPRAVTLAKMEFTRQAALVLGAGVWVLGFISAFFARPWRRQIAQVCLAGVLVAAVAWSVSPARVWRRADLVAPLPITIAAAGLLSLSILIVPGRRLQAGSAHCGGCGYDLTGNLSGICPECGRPTARHRADRWQAQAEQLAAIGT